MAVVGLAVGLLGVGCSEEPPINVLLISMDTTRADHLGAYGHPEVETPNIDALAADGALFEQCSAPTPMTVPSHASMMTGTDPFVHGVRDNGNFRLAEENVTLAEALQGEGYATGAQVGVFVLNRPYGMAQGFDLYRDTSDVAGAGANDPRVPISQRASNELRADVVVDGAIDWLQGHADRPFFLFVHLFDPHSPYEPPEPFASRYRRPGLDPQVAGYLGEIAYTDQQIGRLTAELARLGLDRNTLVVLTADHGEAFGEHSEIGHSYFVYDTTIRVPLIMRLPGRIEPGGRVGRQVRLIDLAPTVLDLTARPPLPDAQGVSLAPYLDGEAENLELTAYVESLAPFIDYRYSALRGIRDDRWKYVLAPRPELYDVGADPAESTNLYAEHPEVADAMLRRLRAWIEASPAIGASTEKVSGDRRARLESLGYLAASGAGVDGELANLEPAGDDPKDRVEAMRLASTAQHALFAREFTRAEALYRGLVQDDSDNVLLLAKLAQSLVRPDQAAEATALFRRVLELDPDHVMAHEKLARIGLGQGDLESAVEHLGQLARLLPENPAVLLDYGRALAMTRQIGPAAGAFRRVVELDSGNVAARLFLAKIAVVGGEPTEAVAMLEAALEQEPDALQPLVELAWLRATSDDDEVRDGGQALELAERARRLADGESYEVRLVIAAALAEVGRFDDAIAAASVLTQPPSEHPRAMLLAQRAAALEGSARDRRPYRSGEPF